jgi:predicted transcriptional regulator of viral defense system
MPPLEEPDLVLIAARVPRAVICLVSALHYHGITLEIPHEVSIALPPGMKAPQLAHPPIRVFRFYGDGYSVGVETREMNGVTVSVYSPAKTVADCFKFRSRVGIEVAIEALRMGLQQERFQPAQLMQFARICRVTRVMAPYLDTLL